MLLRLASSGLTVDTNEEYWKAEASGRAMGMAAR